jgi:hypothetical protein
VNRCKDKGLDAAIVENVRHQVEQLKVRKHTTHPEAPRLNPPRGWWRGLEGGPLYRVHAFLIIAVGKPKHACSTVRSA